MSNYYENSPADVDLENIKVKLDEVEDVIKTIIDLQLNLVGFSFHVGSGCQNASSYYKAIQDCKFAYLIALQYNIRTKIIDIGGGFSGSNNIISFDEICKNIIDAQNKFFKNKIESNEIRFIAEPGRYFTEGTHTLVVNVMAKKKESDVIKYYLNEGVYGSFNCIHYDHQKPVFEIISFSHNPVSEKSKKCYNSTFFGPSCDSMDVIYKDVQFPELNVGDWLYVKNFGSYTCAPSSCFNGFRLTDFQYIYPDNMPMLVSDSCTSSFSF